MNKNILILVLIFIIPIFGYFYLSQKSVSNVSNANTNRVQLIKFTSNMCGECKRVEPEVNKVMNKYQDTIQYIVIPVQNQNKYNTDMMNKYHVTLVPTIIILDKNQNIAKRIEGYVDAKALDGYIGNLCK
jgi:thioredoxin-related protein